MSHSTQQRKTTSPTSLKLLRECDVNSGPESVCHHQQYTYVGRIGSLDRISEDGQVEEDFLTVDEDGSYFSSIIVYDDKLYILVGSDRGECKIHTYELSGQPIGSFETHTDYASYNKHRIIDSKVFVPNPRSKQIAVYSLTGDFIKHIPCDLCTGDTIAMAVVADNSLVMTVGDTHTVFRINTDSGEVMWTSNHIENPEGVVFYKNRYVLVANFNTDAKIWILDVYTGDCVGELTGKQRENESAKYDMDICGDTLIMAHYYNTTLIEYYLLT